MPTRKRSARRVRYDSVASQPIATPKNQPKTGAERNADWRARKAKQGKVEITGYISRRAKEYLDALAWEKRTGLFVALEEVILSAADRKEKTQKRKEAAQRKAADQSPTRTLWDE